MTKKIEDDTIQEDKIIVEYMEDVMPEKYLDYSMSVIVGRALPDVRDGLKPVHRRILFAMNELGNTYNKPHKKSARIVGEVLGKYHPHGDTAVYDTAVRMAQDFSLRYPLVDGHGNFGSIDGDSAAAMRYTEIRMSKLTDSFLEDIDKETVPWMKNFDETLLEPCLLPVKFPNLLVNGSSGIAVGMTTNIPPHNLNAVLESVEYLINTEKLAKEEFNEDSFLNIVKAPDLPTGGLIENIEGVRSLYKTGRGKFYIVAKTKIETFGKSNDKERIVVEEIPYQVNKARLVEKIATLVKDKKIIGIEDIRDESNREGMRICIELKRGVNSELILNQLKKFTDMRVTFGGILLAVKNNQPKLYSLKDILNEFVSFRYDVIYKRTQFELNKALTRAHILEGFVIALDNIDKVIEIIRHSKDVEEAKTGLKNFFAVSEEQAKAIVEMRLRSLTGMEKEKILEELAELKKLIDYCNLLLTTPAEIYKLIIKEGKEIVSKFGDKRKTEICETIHDIDVEDVMPDNPCMIILTKMGYIKRIPLDKYKNQKRGGKGSGGATLFDGDFISKIYQSSNLEYLLFVTANGRAYKLKAYEIPEVDKTGKGKLIENILPLQENEKIKAMLTLPKNKEVAAKSYVVFFTKNGKIKKIDVVNVSGIYKNGARVITLVEGDEIVFADVAQNENKILVATKQGMACAFDIAEVRAMGRSAGGVRGIKLKTGYKEFSESYEKLRTIVSEKIKEALSEEDPKIRQKKVTQLLEDYYDVIEEDIVIGQNVLGEDIIGIKRLVKEIVDGLANKEISDVYEVIEKKMKRRHIDRDEVVSAAFIKNENDYVLTVTEKGFGRMSPISDYRITGRGMTGVINYRPSNKTGAVISTIEVQPNEEIILSTTKGTFIRTALSESYILGRPSLGIKMMKIADDDTIKMLIKIADDGLQTGENEEDSAE